MISLAMLVAAGLLASPGVEPAPAGASVQKKVCKSVQPVGTLARPKKDCRTQAEWDIVARGNQDGWASMQGRNWAQGTEGTREAQQLPMPNGSPF